MDQVGVAGDTLPFIVLVDPGVGESAVVLERFGLVRPLRVVNPADHSRTGI